MDMARKTPLHKTTDQQHGMDLQRKMQDHTTTMKPSELNRMSAKELRHKKFRMELETQREAKQKGYKDIENKCRKEQRILVKHRVLHE